MMLDSLFGRKPLDDPFHQLVNHFESSDWPVDPDPEYGIVHLSYKGERAEYRCAAAIGVDPLTVQFFTMIPAAIPPEKLMALAEFTARANWGFTLGKFELSFDERQLRFQAGAPLPDGKFSDEVMKRIVVASIVTADAYFPAIMSIIFADASPIAAIRAIESPNQ